MYLTRQLVVLLLLAISTLGCDSQDGDQQVLRLATSTTTRDSGLLEKLIPPFEDRNGVRVEVIAAGSGKALKLGELGEVDVVFVHARSAEDAFMAAGHGTRREDVMYNTFELLGPPSDPARIRGLEVALAFQKISQGNITFVSRGDGSGTHQRELLLWQSSGVRHEGTEYRESGQGMGATLMIASELGAYVLTDRGTYLNFQEKVELKPLAAQSSNLHNPYGILVVGDVKRSAESKDLAAAFVDYLISPMAQQVIADYRLADEQLFVPFHLPSTN